MAAPESQIVWTPANIVTAVRILLIPLFVVAIISPWPDWLDFWPEAHIWKPWVAAFVFIALSATDSVDGYLARSRNEITDLGKFMDPLADKILVTAALLALIEMGSLPSWVALVIITREFIVSGIRMVAATQGAVIAASWYGKAKTVFQMVAIVLFIIKDSHVVRTFSDVLHDGLYLFSWAIMFIAVVLTILSMVDYFLKAKTVLGFKETAAADQDDQMAAPAAIGGEAEDVLLEKAAELVRMATERGVTLGTAESCTGGMVSESITSVAGSSACMRGAIVSYDNDIKTGSLGVDAETIATEGAVSRDTALQMAVGARQVLGADYAVSVTGIAGPGGAVEGKPVGTVWVALASSEGACAFEHHFAGDRQTVRRQATCSCLDLLIDACDERL